MQYRFHSFTLDTGQLYLTAGGIPVEAEARQLQLLRLLIERYPEPCSQQQLLEALWPNSVVSHWSAGRLVSDTRKLFRSRGYEGPLIQTLYWHRWLLERGIHKDLSRRLIDHARQFLPRLDSGDTSRV